MIHEELSRLPERSRAAIVCCYFDGMTHEAAAAELGCPVGTVRSRLARARNRLQDRLARRGVTLADGTLGMLLLEGRRSQIPARLLHSTITLTLEPGVQTVGAGVAPASVLSLVDGVLNHMFLRKMAIIGVILLPLGAIVLAGVALALPQRGEMATPGAPRREPRIRQARQETSIPPAGSLLKTYYVGDLIGVEANSKHGQDQPMINMAPLMQLIESTIAPGTWRALDEGLPAASLARPAEAIAPGTLQALDEGGKEIGIEADSGQVGTKGQTDPDRRIGTMTPFLLSVSLIVRHTPEVHEQVAKLFKCLRDYRFQPVHSQSYNTSEDRVVAPAPIASGAQAAEHPANARGERKKRLKHLLEQVQREIDALDQDSNLPARPIEPGR